MSSPTDASATSERRRSSQSGLFNNLLAQKRSPTNEAYSQRRASLEEQGAAPGAFGKMWNNLVKPAHTSSETSGASK